jgi:hypothetical protein
MDRLLASPFLTPFHFASFEIVAPVMGPLFFADQVSGVRSWVAGSSLGVLGVGFRSWGLGSGFKVLGFS